MRWFGFDAFASELTEIIEDIAVTLGVKPPRDPAHQSLDPLLAFIGYTAIGCFLGVASLIVRKASFTRGQIATLGLLLTPLLGGVVMQGVGLWLRMSGHKGRATTLTSFWGGAGLVLGFVCIRWLIAL